MNQLKFCTYPPSHHHFSLKHLPCLFFRIAQAVINDLKSGQINLRASSLVYSSFLSLVPLLAFSFAILKAFGAHNAMQPILLELLQPLGDKGIEITQHITEFVSNMKVGTLGTFGFIILLYTIISMTNKIEDAFNHTWRVNNQRNLAERFTRYLSVIIVAPILIFTAFGLSTSITHLAWLKPDEYSSLSNSITALLSFLPKIMIISAFAFSYWFIPNTKVKFSAALLGAFVAGSLWLVGGSLFATYIAHASQQIEIYSVFATLLFLIIWINLGWVILLIGSSIAYYVQHPEQTVYQQTAWHLAIQDEEALSLNMLQTIATPYYQQQAPLNEEELKRALAIPSTLLKSQLNKLESYALITADTATPPHYYPAKPMSDLSLNQVMAIIRKGTQQQQSFSRDLLSNLPEYPEQGTISLKDSVKADS